MVRQVRPLRVYETVTNELANRLLPPYPVQEPAWYKVMNAIPPTQVFTKPLPIRHKPSKKSLRKPKKMWRPQQIVYEEDELRTNFFKDHPWELARPRIILEIDGKDYQKLDWSKGLRQPGLPLSGECVVQRQLYFMHSENMSKDLAYDTARREFYALRQEEEIEKRVQREEARHVGAYFGPNKLQISQTLEDVQFEKWKAWAQDEVDKADASRTAAYANFGEEGSDDIEAAPLLEEEALP